MVLVCPRCGAPSVLLRLPVSAFALYCRRCLVRLQPSAPTPVGAPEPAVRYGGYTVGPRSGET